MLQSCSLRNMSHETLYNVWQVSSSSMSRSLKMCRRGTADSSTCYSTEKFWKGYNFSTRMWKGYLFYPKLYILKQIRVWTTRQSPPPSVLNFVFVPPPAPHTHPPGTKKRSLIVFRTLQTRLLTFSEASSDDQRIVFEGPNSASCVPDKIVWKRICEC